MTPRIQIDKINSDYNKKSISAALWMGKCGVYSGVALMNISAPKGLFAWRWGTPDW